MEKLLLSLLNLSSSEVETVQTASNGDYISYHVTLSKPHFKRCDRCGSVHLTGNGYTTRKVTLTQDALDHSIVFLRIPRVRCKDCDHTMQAQHHIAPKRSSISFQAIIKIMKLLKDQHSTFKSVSAQLSIPESTVIRVFDKYCHLPSVVFPEVVCIDEVYSKNTEYDSKYICILYDFFLQRIIDVLPSRQKDYLHMHFQSVSKKQLDNVKYVCIDMYKSYKEISLCYFKKAAICVDSFHVIKLLNDCLSKVRINLMNGFDRSSLEYYLLKRFKYLLFKNNINLDGEGKYNRKIGKVINLRGILNMMLGIDDKLQKAFVLKQHYTEFNRSCSYEEAAKNLDVLIEEATVINVPEMIPFLTAISNWKKEIVNSFTVYNERRINNGIAESLNSVIATILYNTRGIKDAERRKKRIMYVVNKDEFLL